MSIIAAATMAMTMMLGSAVSASALDTGTYVPGTDKGSITVHKYKTDQASTTIGTGQELTGSSLPSGTPLAGAGFTLYKLDTAKVEGNGAAAATQAPTAAGLDAFKTTYGATQVGSVVTTDVNGQAVFGKDAGGNDSLDLGYYLLVETTTPAGVTAAAPSIITLPYQYNNTYNKDVHVYPKNVSNKPVDKKLTTANVNIVGASQDLAYDITSKFSNLNDPKQLYNNTVAPAKSASLSIVDTPTYAPVNGVNQRVMDLKTGSPTATVYRADGSSVEWDAATVAAYFDPSSVNGTTAVPSYTWALNSTGAQALADVFQNNGTATDPIWNPVSSIVFHVSFTTNDYVLKLPLKEGVKNTVAVDSTGTDNNKLIDNGTGETTELPTIAFDFSKMELNAAADTASSLTLGTGTGQYPVAQATTWSIATSQENANNKIFLQKDNANLTWTQAANGIVSVSGLGTSTLTDNGATYTGITAAAAAAKTAADHKATVDLWLVETSAPAAFQSLAPLKTTLTITYTPATDSYSVSTIGGNIDGTKAWGASATTVKTNQNTDFGVVNAKPGQTTPGSFQLPNTGGMGTILFAVIGAMLIAAGCFYFLRRRNRQEN